MVLQTKEDEFPKAMKLGSQKVKRQTQEAVLVKRVRPRDRRIVLQRWESLQHMGSFQGGKREVNGEKIQRAGRCEHYQPRVGGESLAPRPQGENKGRTLVGRVVVRLLRELAVFLVKSNCDFPRMR